MGAGVTETVTTFREVVVETSPVDAYASAMGPRGDTVLEPEWAALPEPFLTALNKVIEDFDSASCQANGCEIGRTTRAPAPVGYVLHDDADGAYVSQSWRWLALVQRPDGSVVGVCEDCTPSNVLATDYEPLVAAS